MTATDIANYFGSSPAITLTKEVNDQTEPNPPGLYIPKGDRGDVHLCGHQHRQRDPRPRHSRRQRARSDHLPPDHARPRRRRDLQRGGGDAVAGQYTNTATATGQGVDNTGAPLVLR